jgi:crossover junction endodeoxyribonuclease RuvC
VALLAAAQAGLEIAEYAPNHIKKSVVGVGHAQKEQVQAMVKRLLPACRVEQADAADALAAAIAHAHLAGTRARLLAAQAQSGKARSGFPTDSAPVKESFP